MKAEVPAPQNQTSVCARALIHCETERACSASFVAHERQIRGWAIASRNVAQRLSSGRADKGMEFILGFLVNRFGNQKIDAAPS